MGLGDYGSHYPILAAAVARTHGPILEAGCGDWSTPMLHYMTAGQRALLTLDTDKAWLDRFKGYESHTHILEHVEDWLKHDLLGDAYFAVAFVDCAPGGERHKLIARLQGRAKFIIAHDSERDYGTGANYEYELVRPLFKYVTEWRRFRPYTLILSDEEEFKIEDCDLKWNEKP